MIISGRESKHPKTPLPTRCKKLGHSEKTCRVNLKGRVNPLPHPHQALSVRSPGRELTQNSSPVSTANRRATTRRTAPIVRYSVEQEQPRQQEGARWRARRSATSFWTLGVRGRWCTETWYARERSSRVKP